VVSALERVLEDGCLFGWQGPYPDFGRLLVALRPEEIVARWYHWPHASDERNELQILVRSADWDAVLFSVSSC